MAARFKKGEKPSLDRKQSLAGIPVVNPGVTFRDQEGGGLLARVPVARGTGFLARFQPEVMVKRIKLDEVGAFVVRKIDGERSVLQIIEALIGAYGLNRREAELSTADFLKSLVRKQVISIVIK